MKLSIHEKRFLIGALTHAIAATEGHDAVACWRYRGLRKKLETAVATAKPSPRPASTLSDPQPEDV